MKTKTSFGKFAAAWDEKVGEDGSSIEAIKLQIPIFFDMLGKLTGKKVYDIATGNGFLARKLARSGAKVTASDISPELIEIAKTKYNNKGITYEVREATDIKGLPKNYFDAVIINQGIFFIEDLQPFFKNIAKLLRPKGVLLFNIHHPLLFTSLQAMGRDKINGKKIDHIISAKKYPKDRKVKSYMRFSSDEGYDYWHFKRPISSYINTAGKNGLYVEQVKEPGSIITLKEKSKTSPIPSTFIIKAVKI